LQTNAKPVMSYFIRV